MVGGERGWHQKVRGDGLGKKETKNNFNNDLPALIFVSGTMQALFNASPVVSIIGEPSRRVVARLRPRNIDIRCYDWSQHQPRQKLKVMLRAQIDAERQQYGKRRHGDVSTYLRRVTGNYFKAVEVRK